MTKSEDLNFDVLDGKNQSINQSLSSSPTECSDIDDPLVSEVTDDSVHTNTDSPAQTDTNNDNENQSMKSIVTEPGFERKDEISSFNGSKGGDDERSNIVSNGDSSGIEEEKRLVTPQEALDEIKKQESHNLYCPNCYRNITKDSKLIKKEDEFYPYNRNHFVIKIPLFTRKRTDNKETPNPSPVPSSFVDELKKLFIKKRWPSPSFVSLRFLLVLILLLLSAIVIWSPQTDVERDLPDPSLEKPIISPPSPPGTNATDNENSTPSNGNDNERNLRQNLIEQHAGGNIKIWFLSLFIYVLNFRLLLVLSLLILAILAQLWPSTSFPFRIVSELIEKYQNQTSVTPPYTPQREDAEKEQSGTGSAPSPPEPAAEPAPEPYVVDLIIDKPAWETIIDGIKQIIPRDLDILKSIVYGGLIESITNLGVVSSAAASGASTLNVLALGLANLSSGLFLIIHNLHELLREKPPSETINDGEGETRYKNLLGNRKKWKRHYVVVVFSFIFFGVIPPLFYGLSFKRTDKGHHKAAVVLVASLVCVVFLSFAKACAFNMERLKTVITYTGMAIGASALSFIISHLLSDLLEKNGFHELASDFRKHEFQDLVSRDDVVS